MNIGKQKPKNIVISFFDNLDKKNLTILTFILTLNIDIVNIIIINANTYHLPYKLK